MILETSFILDLWDGTPEAVDKAREIDSRGEPVYLPTPVLYELWEGVARSDRPREEAAKVRDFIDGHDVLPFSDADAREAGLLSGRLSRAGRMMGTVDVQVAGMARARGQALVTADRRFRELADEIRLERYS
ncbi:MAG TPA: PIN domain-containing protein [Thermoplasmata archaeon]|nr:PIN domain-containing protein [Thermoplasmata archaeon]